LLSQWGVDMEPVNVEGNTANLAEMQRLGAPNPPALAVGERIVHGWQPRAYAELAGVPYDGADMLSPDELRRRLERILALAQQALREADGESLELKPPGRDRSVRDLGFHIFRLSSAFVEALELGDFPAEWFRETAPPELRSGEALADFGDKVRHRLDDREDVLRGVHRPRVAGTHDLARGAAHPPDLPSAEGTRAAARRRARSRGVCRAAHAQGDVVGSRGVLVRRHRRPCGVTPRPPPRP
jgi:hypothetical protein